MPPRLPRRFVADRAGDAQEHDSAGGCCGCFVGAVVVVGVKNMTVQVGAVGVLWLTMLATRKNMTVQVGFVGVLWVLWLPLSLWLCRCVLWVFCGCCGRWCCSSRHSPFLLKPQTPSHNPKHPPT